MNSKCWHRGIPSSQISKRTPFESLQWIASKTHSENLQGIPFEIYDGICFDYFFRELSKDSYGNSSRGFMEILPRLPLEIHADTLQWAPLGTPGIYPGITSWITILSHEGKDLQESLKGFLQSLLLNSNRGFSKKSYRDHGWEHLFQKSYTHLLFSQFRNGGLLPCSFISKFGSYHKPKSVEYYDGDSPHDECKWHLFRGE